MRIAIVGNGPSAAGKGEEIDAHDIVVRMNSFLHWGASDTGERMHVYAWFGNDITLRSLGGRLPEGHYVIWATLPPSRCRPFDHRYVGDARNIIEQAGIRYLRWVRESVYRDQAAKLQAWPSTGFTCVDMARREWPDAEISLYGFDATTKDAPGWGDARHEWTPDAPCGHDFAAEKTALASMPGVTFR